MRIRISPFVLLSILITAHTLPVSAETTFDDRQIDELTQQMDVLGKTPEEPPVKKETKPEIVVEEPEEPPTPKGPAVVLKQIEIEGNSVFEDEVFQPYTQKYLNRKVEFEELKQLTTLITDHYRKQGYLTSRAFLPPQKVLNQTIKIQILEGVIGSIFIKDSKYFRESTYRNVLFKPKKNVFRYQDLEKQLYYLNGLPDRKVKTYLIAGLEPGTSDIIVQAKETFPIHLSYEFNNRGTKSTHRARHVLQAVHNSLLGFGDRFLSNLTLAQEGAILGGAFQYSIPYEKTGTTFALTSSVSKSQLVKDLKAFEIEGESFSIIPEVSQRVIRTKRFIGDLNVGFEIKDSETTLADNRLFFDRMRVLKAGPEFTVKDSHGQTGVSLQYRYGIPNFLGSLDREDDRGSRNHSGGEFTAYEINMTRIHRLPKSAALIIKGEGQWSWDTLTSLEQFRAGGVTSVRGYPESDSTGDYGYQFSGEIRIPPYGIPRELKIPKTQESWLNAIRLLAFVEGGKTYLHQRSNPSAVKDKLLLSSGFGVRFAVSRFASFQLDWGFPFGDKSSDDKDSGQIHLSARAGI